MSTGCSPADFQAVLDILSDPVAAAHVCDSLNVGSMGAMASVLAYTVAQVRHVGWSRVLAIDSPSASYLYVDIRSLSALRCEGRAGRFPVEPRIDDTGHAVWP